MYACSLPLPSELRVQGGPIISIHFEIPRFFLQIVPIFKILSPGDS